MNIAVVVLWTALILLGIALLIVGLWLRRADEVREGVPGNAVALVGVFLVVGGGIGLRQELAR